MREFIVCMIVLGFIIAAITYNPKPTVSERLDLIITRLDKIEYLIIMKKPYEKEVK